MKYEYECKKCNKKVSIDKPMSESSKKEYCPDCKEEMSRVFSLGIKTSDGFKN